MGRVTAVLKGEMQPRARAGFIMAFDFAHDTTLGDSNLESPWDDGPENATAHAARDVEWTKISSDFTNVRFIANAMHEQPPPTRAYLRPAIAKVSPLEKSRHFKRDLMLALHKLVLPLAAR